MVHSPYNDHLFNEQIVEHMPDHMLEGLPKWNRTIAERLAASEGISLADEHWEVLHFLRRRFATLGQVRYARELSRELEMEIAGVRGSRYLFSLFPGGPVSQGCRIAGLPQPPAHEDPSFGSVQ